MKYEINYAKVTKKDGIVWKRETFDKEIDALKRLNVVHRQKGYFDSIPIKVIKE